MPKRFEERGLLKPHEVSRLQRVLSKACASRNIEPSSEEARELALTLLALHDAGMEDEDMLADAVAFPRVR